VNRCAFAGRFWRSSSIWREIGTRVAGRQRAADLQIHSIVHGIVSLDHLAIEFGAGGVVYGSETEGFEISRRLPRLHHRHRRSEVSVPSPLNTTRFCRRKCQQQYCRTRPVAVVDWIAGPARSCRGPAWQPTLAAQFAAGAKRGGGLRLSFSMNCARPSGRAAGIGTDITRFVKKSDRQFS
jgi:hypothetical protein